MLLVFVKYVRVPDGLGKVICFISPSMFAIYLIHNVASFGPSLYQVPQRWFVSHTGLHPILIVFLTAIGTFIACLLIDIIRRAVLASLRPRLLRD